MDTKQFLKCAQAYQSGLSEGLMSPALDDAEERDGDLISRQAAIDAVCKYCEYYYNENVIQSIKEIPFAEQEPHWIPCSERLPDEEDAKILRKFGVKKQSEYVLATVEVKDERMTVTTCTYDGEWDWKMKHALPDYRVIAWMPLPEPYEGE